MRDIATLVLGLPAGVLALFAGVAVYQSWSPAMSWALLLGLPVTAVACAVIVSRLVRASERGVPQVVDAPSRMLDLRDEGRWLDNRLKWARLVEAEGMPQASPVARAGEPGPVNVNDRWLEELA